MCWKQQIQEDVQRTDRLRLSVEQLERWQMSEKAWLRQHCYTNGTLFSVVGGGQSSTLGRVQSVLNKTSKFILNSLKEPCEMISRPQHPNWTRWWLLMGANSWPQKILELCSGSNLGLLSMLFRECDYSYNAFRHAVLLYEQPRRSDYSPTFTDTCEAVACRVNIHPEFRHLLDRVVNSKSVKAIVVTSGLRLVWQKRLQKAGLFDSVTVFGGGQLNDYVITPEVKAEIVKSLQGEGLYVWAFGDSKMVVPMSRQADQAIVVVGTEESRSKSKESSLEEAIDEKCLQARQVWLPSAVSTRLDVEKLPTTALENVDVIQARRSNKQSSSQTPDDADS